MGRYKVNLNCNEVHSLSLNVCQIHGLFIQNNETRLCEYQFGRGAVYVELPNQRALGIPDVNTLATT